MKTPRVTLADLENGPATVNVETAAEFIGISRAAAYAAVRNGTFPARTITVGKRVKVITASLIDVLGANAAA